MTDEKIFDQAIQLPPGERADFLAEACKDQREQRQRVEFEELDHPAAKRPERFLQLDDALTQLEEQSVIRPEP
jgi:hypothetical protein